MQCLCALNNAVAAGSDSTHNGRVICIISFVATCLKPTHKPITNFIWDHDIISKMDFFIELIFRVE